MPECVRQSGQDLDVQTPADCGNWSYSVSSTPDGATITIRARLPVFIYGLNLVCFVLLAVILFLPLVVGWWGRGQHLTAAIGLILTSVGIMRWTFPIVWGLYGQRILSIEGSTMALERRLFHIGFPQLLALERVTGLRLYVPPQRFWRLPVGRILDGMKPSDWIEFAQEQKRTCIAVLCNGKT